MDRETDNAAPPLSARTRSRSTRDAFSREIQQHEEAHPPGECRPFLARRAGLLGELAVVIALMISLALLYARSRMPLEYALNSGWNEYIRMVDHIWRRGIEEYYNPWRKPMYPYLVGAWSKISGVTNHRAAFQLATASTLLMVICAAAVARGLAGRWAAVVAGLSISFMPVVVESAHWINAYPVLGAAIGITMAAGVGAVRTGSVLLAGLAGAAAGISSSLDYRGLLAVGAGALLVLGSARLSRPWRSALLLAAFALPVLAFHELEGWMIDTWNIPTVPFEEQLVHQHDLILESTRAAYENGTVAQPCLDVPPGLPTARGLLHPCARYLFLGNMNMLRPRSLPGWIGAAGLLLALLPTIGGGTRSSWASAAVFVSTAASLFLGASWVHYFHRYSLPLAVPVAALLPVAVVRLIHQAKRWIDGPRGLTTVHLCAGVAAALVATLAWPGPARLRQQMAPHFQEPPCGVVVPCDTWEMFAIADWLNRNTVAGDLVLNCADIGLGPLLNRTLQRAYGAQFTTHCQGFVRFPPKSSGNTWLVVWDPLEVPCSPQEGTVMEDFELETIEQQGWRRQGGWSENAPTPARIHLFKRRLRR